MRTPYQKSVSPDTDQLSDRLLHRCARDLALGLIDLDRDETDRSNLLNSLVLIGSLDDARENTTRTIRCLVCESHGSYIQSVLHLAQLQVPLLSLLLQNGLR